MKAFVKDLSSQKEGIVDTDVIFELCDDGSRKKFNPDTFKSTKWYAVAKGQNLNRIGIYYYADNVEALQDMMKADKDNRLRSKKLPKRLSHGPLVLDVSKFTLVEEVKASKELKVNQDKAVSEADQERRNKLLNRIGGKPDKAKRKLLDAPDDQMNDDQKKKTKTEVQVHIQKDTENVGPDETVQGGTGMLEVVNGEASAGDKACMNTNQVISGKATVVISQGEYDLLLKQIHLYSERCFELEERLKESKNINLRLEKIEAALEALKAAHPDPSKAPKKCKLRDLQDICEDGGDYIIPEGHVHVGMIGDERRFISKRKLAEVEKESKQFRPRLSAVLILLYGKESIGNWSVSGFNSKTKEKLNKIPLHHYKILSVLLDSMIWRSKEDLSVERLQRNVSRALSAMKSVNEGKGKEAAVPAGQQQETAEDKIPAEGNAASVVVDTDKKEGAIDQVIGEKEAEVIEEGEKEAEVIEEGNESEPEEDLGAPSSFVMRDLSF